MYVYVYVYVYIYIYIYLSLYIYMYIYIYVYIFHSLSFSIESPPDISPSRTCVREVKMGHGPRGEEARVAEIGKVGCSSAVQLALGAARSLAPRLGEGWAESDASEADRGTLTLRISP